jgi:hypothetical protein
MTRLPNSFLQKHERFILFFCGVLVSAIVSSLLSRVISWSEGGLFFAILVIIVASVFYFSEIYQRVQEILGKAQTTVFSVEESYREHEGIEYKGRAYLELTRLIKEARFEILTLSTFSSVDEGGRITPIPRVMSTLEHLRRRLIETS